MGATVEGVPELREVSLPEYTPDGEKWMRLADAEAAGADMNGYGNDIGPRRRGVIYYGAYWGDTNIVHDVFVCVMRVRDGRGRFAGLRIVSYQVAEESAKGPSAGRVRRHMTSWAYDRRNRVLSTPEGGTE